MNNENQQPQPEAPVQEVAESEIREADLDQVSGAGVAIPDRHKNPND
jgi:hypothetical protein